MSQYDTFPVDADYSVTRSKESNVLSAKLDSGRLYLRQKGPPRRIIDLVFNRRSRVDWASIENFRLAHMSDFFTWLDKSAEPGPRSYSVYFNTEPTYEEVGNEQVNIKCQLIEAAGQPMLTYPDFGSTPPGTSHNLPLSSAQNLGANGYQWLYAGYGYRVNGTFASIFLDEADATAFPTNIAVPLGLHRVRVVGGAPTSLDYMI